jgi:hypothetical protein
MKLTSHLFLGIVTAFSFNVSAADSSAVSPKGFCTDISNGILADLATADLFKTNNTIKDFMDANSGFAQGKSADRPPIQIYRADGVSPDHQTSMTVWIFPKQLNYVAQYNDLGVGINTDINYFFDDSCQLRQADRSTWDPMQYSADIPDVYANKITCAKGVDKSIIDPTNIGGTNEALRWLKSTCEKYFKVTPPGLDDLKKTAD